MLHTFIGYMYVKLKPKFGEDIIYVRCFFSAHTKRYWPDTLAIVAPQVESVGQEDWKVA